MENSPHRSPNDLGIERVARGSDDRQIKHAESHAGTHDGPEIPHVGRVHQDDVVRLLVQRGFPFGELADYHRVLFPRKVFENPFVVEDERNVMLLRESF